MKIYALVWIINIQNIVYFERNVSVFFGFQFRSSRSLSISHPNSNTQIKRARKWTAAKNRKC